MKFHIFLTTTYNLQANHYCKIKTHQKISYYDYYLYIKTAYQYLQDLSPKNLLKKLHQIQRPHGHLIVKVDSSTGHSLILGFDWQQSKRCQKDVTIIHNHENGCGFQWWSRLKTGIYTRKFNRTAEVKQLVSNFHLIPSVYNRLILKQKYNKTKTGMGGTVPYEDQR